MELSSSLRTIIGQTLVVDVGACRRGLEDVRSARGVLDAHELQLLARLDELTVNEPAIFPEAELAAAAKSSLSKATKVRHRKETCERVPELGAALSTGATTGDRVDVLANATRGLNPAELGRVAEQGSVIAKMASTGTPRQYRETVEQIVGQARDDDGLGCLARQRRASRLRWWTDTHGMWNLAGCFDPVRGVELEGRLRNVIETLFHDKTPDDAPSDSLELQEFLAAAAFVSICDGKAGSSGLPDVTVLIDERTLLEGRRHASSVIDAGLGRFGLPVETVRRWACIGKVTPVVVGAEGVRLFLGRETRLANRARRPHSHHHQTRRHDHQRTTPTPCGLTDGEPSVQGKRRCAAVYGRLSAMDSRQQTDVVFQGSIPQMYEAYMVPLIFEPYAPDIADRVTAFEPSTVLELAAGTGVVTRQLAARLPASTSITATDLNSPMVDHASSIGTARPISWQQADAQALPFDDASFDVVVCQFGVMFFDRAKAFAEVYRVLRPGGAFVFNTWDRIEANEFADVVTEAVSTMFPDDPPVFLRRTPHGYHDVEQIRSDVSDAGFDPESEIVTLDRRSRAASNEIPAVAYCQGTPLRMELEARAPGSVPEATAVGAAAVAARFGELDLDSLIRAHVVTARKSK